MKNNLYRAGVVAGFVIVMIAIIVVYHPWQSSKKLADNNPSQASSLHCGLRVVTPAPNLSVAFPLTVSGTVDNTKSKSVGCSWSMFEGQAGTLQLSYRDSVHQSWDKLGSPVVIHVGDWTTTASTTFTTTVPLDNGNVTLPSGTKLQLTFTEENPSGEGIPDTYTLPVTLE